MGKNLEVVINAPILTDPKFIEAAAQAALERVAEAIITDVTQVRAKEFADSPGKWSFPLGGYETSQEYYGKGMIPYWRGGLLGSFDKLGSSEPFSYDIGFTAIYAPLIEEGGTRSAEIPVQWMEDKQVDAGGSYLIKPHPFTAAVAEKIASNLNAFGYLEVFQTAFVTAMR